MLKKVLILVTGFLFFGASLYAAGDLIVDGNLGIGTTNPEQMFHLVGGRLIVENNETDKKRVFFYYNTASDAAVLSSYDSLNNRYKTLLINRGGGYVGIGRWTVSYPLHMGSGAYVTAGGVWTNASSREYKENIKKLTPEEALYALKELNPVKFNYKADIKEKHLGFIAEDVPDILATQDRKGLSPMDIVAVLTRVVQEQQETISKLSEKVDKLENSSGEHYKSLASN